jgi:hypothetical protein
MHIAMTIWKYGNENAIMGRYVDVCMVMVVWRLKLVW